MSPTIRIDEEVYEALKRRAEPFVDTPNSVLRRLLELAPGQEQGGDREDPSARVVPTGAPELNKPAARTVVTRPGGKKVVLVPRPKKVAKPAKRTRVPNGSLLPEDQYDLPLLRTLAEQGGTVAYKDLVKGVEEKLNGRLTELDRANLSSGGVRWQSRLQFVRLRLIERGLMSKDAPRGFWAITEEGRQFVAHSLNGTA